MQILICKDDLIDSKPNPIRSNHTRLMFDVLLSISVAFGVTYFAIPAILRVAEQKKLFDVPDERKIHLAHIPSLGGLGIFAGFIIACLLAVSFHQTPEFQYFFAAALVMFFLGLKDDILVISPVKKFIGQVVAAILIIYKGGLQIKSMHGFLGVYDIPETYSLLLSYFTVIVIINSFNLIDGIDGLAGSLGLLATTIFGIYFVRADMTQYAVIAFAMSGSLAAFLIFNFHPARIFMGDTGSMLLGLVNAILVIKFIDVAGSPSSVVPLVSAPALGFIVLLIPLMDTLRVFAIRMFFRRSPFIPDRNHIHHLMVDKGWSHKTITFTLSTFAVLLVISAYLLRNAGCTVIILSGICLFAGGIAALYFPRRSRLFVARTSSVKDRPSANVVPLTEHIFLEEKN